MLESTARSADASQENLLGIRAGSRPSQAQRLFFGPTTRIAGGSALGLTESAQQQSWSYAHARPTQGPEDQALASSPLERLNRGRKKNRASASAEASKESTFKNHC